MVFFVIGKFGLLSIQICFIADLRTLKSKLIARERIKNHINMSFAHLLCTRCGIRT